MFSDGSTVACDTLIGPGLATWDLSLLKDTRLKERMNLQFRAGAFNLLNRANFTTPNRGCLHPLRSFIHGGRHHQHGNYVAADSARPQTALVNFRHQSGRMQVSPTAVSARPVTIIGQFA